MERPPERSKRLHNFSLPYLRWGQQKYLRCVKLPSNSHHRSLPPPPPSSSYSSPNHAANRSIAISGNEKLKGAASNGEGDARPWNLRTRRAACSDPGDESPAKIVDSLRRNEIGGKRGGIDGYDSDAYKLKFSVSLLKDEIEEDFSTIFGKKLPKRPKKRPKLVQKKLNTIFPGMWLDEEVTTDSYNVSEAKET